MRRQPDAGVLELETRRRIYHQVRRAPGMHFRQLQRALKMAVGTLEHNLRALEQDGAVAVREQQNRRCYFVGAGMDRRDRDVLVHLRNQLPRQILLAVTQEPGIGFGKLRARLDVHAGRLSLHLKRLIGAGVLRVRAEGRQRFYDVDDPSRVARLAVTYRRSYSDAMVDRFAATWGRL